MTKERRRPTDTKGQKLPLPRDKRPAGKRSVTDKERATRMLAKAKTRDLTTDELKVLSVVQLSEYATIHQDRQKRKNAR